MSRGHDHGSDYCYACIEEGRRNKRIEGLVKAIQKALILSRDGVNRTEWAEILENALADYENRS